MAYLVLDLDGTFWVVKDNENTIHPAQKLGNSFSVPILNEQIEISIINPENITELLNEAQ